MTKERTPLHGGLIAAKGAAVPAMDTPARSEPPPIPAPTIPSGAAELVPLNFRVPASFRKRLKEYAVRHDRAMVDVMTEAVDAFLADKP